MNTSNDGTAPRRGRPPKIKTPEPVFSKLPDPLLPPGVVSDPPPPPVFVAETEQKKFSMQYKVLENNQNKMFEVRFRCSRCCVTVSTMTLCYSLPNCACCHAPMSRLKDW